MQIFSIKNLRLSVIYWVAPEINVTSCNSECMLAMNWQLSRGRVRDQKYIEEEVEKEKSINWSEVFALSDFEEVESDMPL